MRHISAAHAWAAHTPVSAHLLQRSILRTGHKKALAVEQGLGKEMASAQDRMARFLFMAIMPLTMR